MQKQEDENEAIRERLVRLVNERSQSEVARKTGTQVAAVNRYVHGARIPAGFCTALVRGLGVNPSWLLNGEGSAYLADVPERTAQLGGNLLELVEAMSAVSRMLLGTLAGKRHLTVLRELNDALLAHERLRADLNEKTRPVFERLLNDFDAALNKLDLDHAGELRKAAEQLSRLCDDEKLTRHFLRASAFHDFQLKRPERFLKSQRKLFLRSLPDGALFDETACDEARRIVVALVQMNRIQEARRVCMAVRALAGKRGRKWDAWARLQNTWSVIQLETGRLRPAIAAMQQAIPRLEGMYRKVSEATLVKMLMWSNVLTFEDALSIGETTDPKAEHLMQYACWRLDASMIERAISYARTPGIVQVWGPGVFHIYSDYLLKQLKRPARNAADEFTREQRARMPDFEPEIGDFVVACLRCELLRVGKFAPEARVVLRESEAMRQAFKGELLPGPLELATHYRGALALIDNPRTAADRALIQRARRYFNRRIKAGYLCLQDGMTGIV
jgi:transcriptional regulator with XRE-family HTH domain